MRTNINTTVKSTLLTLLLLPMAAMAAGDLWGPNDESFPSLQVRWDKVKDCWADNPPGHDPENYGQYGSVCYETTGGWFFGEAKNSGSSIAAYIGGEYVNFGAAPSPPLTDDMGAPLIGNGFKVSYHAGPAESENKPGLAAFAVNFGPDDGAGNATDIASKGGFCVTYASDVDIKLELGWHEGTYDYNTWQAPLPAKPSGGMVEVRWDATATGATSGDFSRETWAPTHPIATAIGEAISVKFPLKNTSSTLDKNGYFRLCELGWAGSGCGSACALGSEIGGTTITITNPPSGNIRAYAANNAIVLENLQKGAKVEVYSLQGKLIYKSSKSLNQVNQGSDKIPIQTKGIYIVKTETQSFRVAVK